MCVCFPLCACSAGGLCPCTQPCAQVAHAAGISMAATAQGPEGWSVASGLYLLAGTTDRSAHAAWRHPILSACRSTRFYVFMCVLCKMGGCTSVASTSETSLVHASCMMFEFFTFNSFEVMNKQELHHWEKRGAANVSSTLPT